MNGNYLIMLVEDREIQASGLQTNIEKTGCWKVIVCTSAEAALQTLIKMDAEREKLPDVVSVDLGLPPNPNDSSIGLKLLEDISSIWRGLNLTVHTAQTLKEETLRKIISLNSSCISLNDIGESKPYIELLPFVAQGYKVFSPIAGSLLTEIITMKHDPFGPNPEYWITLQALSKGDSYKDIANTECVSERAILARVRKAVYRLIELGEIPPLAKSVDLIHDKYKRLAINWYRNNHVRFGR
jgi:DNA-binding NarL/FixJ family response regulator